MKGVGLVKSAVMVAAPAAAAREWGGSTMRTQAKRSGVRLSVQKGRLVADMIRGQSVEKALNIPDLIAEGTISYGMQSFDQSLMKWYREGVISYESALFYSSNPSEFALRVSGVSSASDNTFDEPGKGGLDLSQGFTP